MSSYFPLNIYLNDRETNEKFDKFHVKYELRYELVLDVATSKNTRLA